LGIPLDDFYRVNSLPATHPWNIQMRALADAVNSTGKPVMLQLVLTRDRAVGKVSISNGKIVMDKGWANGCIDFSAPANANLRTSFVNYMVYMVRLFRPKYLVLMVEVNLYWVYCGGSTANWDRLVAIQRNAFDVARNISPDTVVFPSFKLEDIYNQSTTGYDSAHWAAMAQLKKQRIGIASYPYALRRSNGSFISPYDLPLDYFSRIRDRNPKEPPIVITETGWNSTGLTFGDTTTCYRDYIYSNESFAVAYMNLLFYSAAARGIAGITWWSHRDLITTTAMGSCYPAATGPSFSACNGEPWCRAINAMKTETPEWTPLFAELVFKVFGTMGLQTYEGSPRSQLTNAWNVQKRVPWTGN
jgi:hypothetical protein